MPKSDILRLRQSDEALLEAVCNESVGGTVSIPAQAENNPIKA
ncbi:MAG: hypothetical protein ABGX37_06225 [Methylococcales bacterium]